jgi:hypothetical protein
MTFIWCMCYTILANSAISIIVKICSKNHHSRRCMKPYLLYKHEIVNVLSFPCAWMEMLIAFSFLTIIYKCMQAFPGLVGL